MAKPVLGRGLSALLSGVTSSKQSANVFQGPPAASSASESSAASAAATPVAAAIPDTREHVEKVAVERVHPCPFQPRKDFSQESLQELADSIKENGILQPLIVRKKDDQFEIIAGERRWRASQLLGLKEIPVIVREADDRAVLELALIENLQRENLNPIEEAQGFSQLMSQFQLTQEEAAAKVGKSRAVVANALRLLKLAPDLLPHLRDGRLSVGHAKVILGLATWDEQKLAAERVLKKSLNVRQTEELVAYLQNKPTEKSSGSTASGVAPVPDAHVADIERKLQERLGTRVHLRYRKGKGSLEIKFFSDDDLERILKITGVELD
jgi:ParB family chromosome partitioning protein